MIRPAKPSDLNAIIELGMEALLKDPYQGLTPDKSKVAGWAQYGISCPKDFVWVSEINGEVVAAVSAHVEPMTFYKESAANVMQFYSRVPGEGIKLLRQMLKWYHSRSALKALIFTLECGADPRIIKLLRRLGLSIELPVMMATKGVKR